MKPLYVTKGKIMECSCIIQPSWWSLHGVPECTLQISQVVPYKDGLLSGAWQFKNLKLSLCNLVPEVWKERTRNFMNLTSHQLISGRCAQFGDLAEVRDKFPPEKNTRTLSALAVTPLSPRRHSTSLNAESSRKCFTVFKSLSYLSARSVSSWSLSA